MYICIILLSMNKVTDMQAENQIFQAHGMI